MEALTLVTGMQQNVQSAAEPHHTAAGQTFIAHMLTLGGQVHRLPRQGARCGKLQLLHAVVQFRAVGRRIRRHFWRPILGKRPSASYRQKTQQDRRRRASVNRVDHGHVHTPTSLKHR
jgi:hypothetical protein